jgi:hypothetical protein
MKRVFIALILLAFVFPANYRVQAQEVPGMEEVLNLEKQVDAELEALYGPAQTGAGYEVEASSTSDCFYTDVDRDPATAGPITVNSQYLSISSSFCGNTNTAMITISSRWWGMSGKSQRVWGFVAVRDADDILVDVIPFDSSNNPLSQGALNIQISWIAPHRQEVFRFEVEANLRMLPDNVGPGTLKTTWYYQAAPFRVYLPVVFKQPPPPTENCEVQLHVRGQYAVDEYYCFTIQGNAFAMLHFGYGEKVDIEWVDKTHNRLFAFPGVSHIFRLTWWDGYKDYSDPGIVIQASTWPKAGLPPWLATEHMISGQYTDSSGVEWRVTVPMIWDP